MNIDQARCEAFWQGFLDSLTADDPRRAAQPDRFGFGGEPRLADELAALVTAGKKRATASLPVEYTALGEALPQVGDLSIIVNGRGLPVLIIQRTAVDLVPFEAVDAQFAAREGEGDGSLDYWRRAHTDYFTGVCARLGGSFGRTSPVLCQSFRVVWPEDVGAAGVPP